MEYRFASDEWSAMTSVQRVMRCQTMRAEALKLADSAPQHLKQNYLKIANEWLMLADAIRRGDSN
jgi:hypothetical protein